MILSVKKISSSVTDKDLKDLFDKYGAKRIDLKESKEKGEKFAFIYIPDKKNAEKAVKQLDGFELKGKHIRVKIKEEGTTQNKEPVKAEQKNEAQPQEKNKLPEKFPYAFFNRPPRKKPIVAFHDRLLDKHYDIAFEITWETLTPTALNPCIDEEAPSCYPKINKDDYSGYNRRWLTIDNHLAISPFTVKSAIANGFANIMGGCYRVNNIEEPHKEDVSKGQYLYSGKYKRYRVAMDGSSKPGIVKEIEPESDGSKKVTIIPVKEYYLDDDLPKGLNLNSGDTVYAKVIKNRGHKPPIIGGISKKSYNGSIELKYHGVFSYKRNSVPHPKHKHRFYTENGSEVTGTIPAINFLPENELKKHVSIGGADPEDKPTKWYQNLNTINVGSFVYYETFNGKVTNIGKNFLFKALFSHEDTVPEESSECVDLTGELCPRCRMFGMTDKKNKDLESIGFKGRFKSSALINDLIIEKSEKKETISIRETIKDENKNKEIITRNLILNEWVEKDTNNPIATQELLPISGPPKPNRRDVDGYFNKTTGEIKGAKYYLHGTLNSARNIHEVDKDENYTHRLRNYAQVARPHLRFTGTVGAENCNLEEIATFIILLHSDFSHHGFKIGLGKAFGMGSVKSYINRIWIRRKDDYENWHLVKNEDLSEEDLLKSLENSLNGITATYQGLKETVNNTIDIINKLDGMENRVLKYPDAGLNYWRMAFK